MTTITSDQLWKAFTAKGFTTTESLPPPPIHESPWFIRVMLGFSGWLGALFLLGFIGATFGRWLRGDTVAMTAGAILCAAAFFLFLQRRNDFATQFALAVSFAGQAVFIFGVMDAFSWRGGFSYLVVAAAEAVLVAAIPNPIHRIASAFAAAISFSMALSRYAAPHLGPAVLSAMFAVVWLNEMRWAARGTLVRHLGYGLVLAVLCMHTMRLVPEFNGTVRNAEASLLILRLSYWISVAVSGAVLLFTVSRLTAREGLGGGERSAQLALVAALLFAAFSYTAPGVTAGLAIVLLGYANGNKTLMSLGLVGLCAYIGAYYYQMNVTLAVKSAALTATGSTLLMGRFALTKLLPERSHEGVEHA